MNATYHFNRRLLGACASTRFVAPEGYISSSIVTPVFATVFLDGRVAVGATPHMMTAVYDDSLAADNNPTISDEHHRMPHDHIALHISSDILSALVSLSGPERVRIVLLPDAAEWHIGDKKITEESVDYSYFQGDEDRHYPNYTVLISQSVREVEKLIETWNDLERHIFPSAFSVTLDSIQIEMINKIANLLTPHKPTPILISGGTPDYHVVRYCSPGGSLRHDVFTLIGARTQQLDDFSKYNIFPSFAFIGNDKQFPIWTAFRDYDDSTELPDDEYIDDEVLDEDELEEDQDD